MNIYGITKNKNKYKEKIHKHQTQSLGFLRIKFSSKENVNKMKNFSLYINISPKEQMQFKII